LYFDPERGIHLRPSYAILVLSCAASWLGAAPPSTYKPDSVRAEKPAKPPAASEDPYAVETTPPRDTAVLTPSDSAAAASAAADTAVAAPDTASVADTVAAPESDAVPEPEKKQRPRLTRETTVNTMDDMKGRYRSPKKALFMSLLVPGLGQAYVGQSAFNYARAVAYLGTDVALGIFWYHYVVVKYDRKVKQYRGFADENWRQGKYEDSMQVVSDAVTSDQFKQINLFRESYCDAVQDQSSTAGNSLYQGCLDPKANSAGYDLFRASHDDQNWQPDSVAAWRGKFPRLFDFYELIGKEQEFVAGWVDAQGVSYNISGDSITISGTSELRDQYIGMRATANRYARMQAWFLGGIVVNHIVSALDAALSARHHNKALYQTETGLLDRMRLDGGLAFDGVWPRTRVAAIFTF
jgi:hypothetical protein